MLENIFDVSYKKLDPRIQDPGFLRAKFREIILVGPKKGPHFVVNFGKLWLVFAACGMFWKLVETCGKFWQVVSTCDNYWQVAAICSNLWQKLAKFLYLLTNFGNF